MVKELFQNLVQKSGLNKGDATSGVAVGGVSLGLMFMLFVSFRQYDGDMARLQSQNALLWHEAHVTEDALATHGIYVPRSDSTTTTNLDK